MLLSLAFLLVLVWVAALVTMKVTGIAIHLLLILAVFSFVMHLLRPTVPPSAPPTV